MLRLLFLASVAYGAAIPPPSPSCLEKCLVQGGVVGAAADLNFFKSVAVDITNFCNVYTTLLKCASDCSQDDLNLLLNHTIHASYVCKEKMEEIKTVHDCLESNTSDPLADCGKMCEVSDHVPLRLDSTATAPVNPNVPAEGTAPICTQQMCVLKCAKVQLNKQCAGAGDLFEEVARHQVSVGVEMLQAQSENVNDTASQLVALSYLANVPEKCIFLTNLEMFDSEIMGEKKVDSPDFAFSNDSSPAENPSDMGIPAVSIDSPVMTDAKDEGLHEQPAPAMVPSGASGSSESEDDESEEKEAAMGPSSGEGVITGEGTGLVPSRTVTEEDKDKEEVEDAEKESAMTGGEHKTEEDHDEEKPAVEGEEEDGTAEEGTAEENKDGEGMKGEESAMETTPVIVVDDGVESNEIIPSSTEAAKMNSSTGRTLFASFIVAILALLI